MYRHRFGMTLALCLTLAVTAWAQQPQTFVENFNQTPLQDWMLHEGAHVAEVGNLGNALQFTDPGFAEAMVETGDTFTLVYQFTPLQADSMMAVIFRNSGEPPENREYVLVYERGAMELMKFVEEQGQPLAQAEAPIEQNRLATMKLQVSGGKMTVSMANAQGSYREIMTATDRQPLGPGGLAFEGFGVAIDNVSLAHGQTAGQQTAGQTVATGQQVGGQQTATGGQTVATGQQIGVGQQGGQQGGGQGQGLTQYQPPATFQPGSSGVYLYLQGVQGECKVKGLQGWINCTDWAFSIDPTIMQSGTGEKQPMLESSNHYVNITREIDGATPQLWTRSAKLTSMPTGRIIVVRAGRIQIDLSLRNVTIHAAGREKDAMDGSAGSVSSETLTLAPEAVNWVVPVYDHSGNIKGAYKGRMTMSAG